MPQLTSDEIVDFVLLASTVDDVELLNLGTIIWGVLATRHSETAQESVDYFRSIARMRGVESAIRQNWDSQRRVHLMVMAHLAKNESADTPPGAANAP